MWEQLCKNTIGLDGEEMEILSRIESTLPYMADLVGADVFIDCFYEDGAKCMVVAEAQPTGNLSIYGRSVVGEDATLENEPAVFAVRKTGMPVRNLRATTQENKLVRQDVIPIKNSGGKVFGVLIREKDVSEQIRQDRKYLELAQTVRRLTAQLQETGGLEYEQSDDGFALKETHHRVKNNLQMVASILNMQARRSPTPEMKAAFKENVSRVLSFAAIHEILTRDGLEDNLCILEVIEKVRRNTAVYSNNEERQVTITVEGDDFLVTADNATSIALVVNELLANAVEHAFVGRSKGHITVSVQHGAQYSTITVSDDGSGFDFEEKRNKNLGLSIVNLTVRDRLKGKLRVVSGRDGSTIQFDFAN